MRNLKLLVCVAINLLLTSMVTLLTTLLGWVIVVIPVSLLAVFMVMQSVYCQNKAQCGHYGILNILSPLNLDGISYINNNLMHIYIF